MPRKPKIGVWFKHIVADRHEITGLWVLWYLTDKEASVCREALRNYHAEKRDKGIERVTSALEAAKLLANHNQGAFMSKKMTEVEFRAKTGMSPKQALERAGMEMEAIAPSPVKELSEAILPQEEKIRIAEKYKPKE